MDSDMKLLRREVRHLINLKLRNYKQRKTHSDFDNYFFEGYIYALSTVDYFIWKIDKDKDKDKQNDDYDQKQYSGLIEEE